MERFRTNTCNYIIAEWLLMGFRGGVLILKSAGMRGSAFDINDGFFNARTLVGVLGIIKNNRHSDDREAVVSEYLNLVAIKDVVQL